MNEHDEVTSDNTEFEQAFNDLEALDRLESGIEEPESSGDNESTIDPLTSAALLGAVEMGLNASEGIIAMASGVDFEYKAEQKGKFIDASGPLLQKYGLTWLEWFDKYKEEAMMGFASFGLFASSVATIKRLRLEQAIMLQAATQSKESTEQGGEHGEETHTATTTTA